MKRIPQSLEAGELADVRRDLGVGDAPLDLVVRIARNTSASTG